MLYVLEKHGSLDGSNLVTWGYDSKGLLGKRGMVVNIQLSACISSK